MLSTKKYLDLDEIKYVLEDLQPIYSIDNNISKQIFDKHIEFLNKELKKIKIYPSKIEQLKLKITKHYYNSQINAGDSVGILTAQSIGERQTQLTLNSFHFSGTTISTVVTGVPRFSELLNATKNPKNVVSLIYFKEPHYTIRELRDTVSSNIVHILFGDIVYENNIRSKRKCKRKKWYSAFNMLNDTIEFDKLKQYSYYIECKCNIELLYKFKIHLSDISNSLMSIFEDIVCVYSPDILGYVDIWFDSNHIKNKQLLKTYIEDILISKLFNTTVCGIQNITQIQYIKNTDDTWYVEALGFNLKKIFSLDFIDNTQTLSNNMWEIFEILGTEATRQFLIEEFINIISVDSYINIRHVELLVDMMLYTGELCSISRYGVQRNQSETLTKSSFEKSLDQFLKAGVFAKNDLIQGVSASIMCGKVSNIGTGLCELIYNN